MPTPLCALTPDEQGLYDELKVDPFGADISEILADAAEDQGYPQRAEFLRRLSEDPAFARDPAARLDFFYRRHASWDERVNLVPIYRVDFRIGE